MRQPDGPALASRHRRVRARLEAAGVEALVVTTPNSIRYLSNHVGTAGVLVLPLSGDVVLLVDGRYTEAVTARQQTVAACPGLEVVPVPGSYEEALVECLGRLGPERIGFEAAHLTVSKFLWLEKALGDRQRGTLIPTYDLLDDVRAVKDELEIALLRDAAARLTGVADAVWPQVRAGLAERDVAGFVEQALRAAGFERPAFDVIAASGPNSALPHHRAGERRLSHGDPLVLDFGGVLDGYCSDVTRTVSIGPASPEVRRLHAAVHEAHDAAIAAVRPGVLTSDVDAAARNVLERHGLGAAFVHGTGHGLGLDVHEAPRVARPRPDLPPTRLDAGMVITVEPGVYIPGLGGVRIEDDILVTGAGADVLTSVPSALVALGGTWT